MMFGIGRKDAAAKVRMLMAERDVNVNELAEITGLSTMTISRIRTGHTTRPTHDTARRIARALGVKVNNIWPNL